MAYANCNGNWEYVPKVFSSYFPFSFIFIGAYLRTCFSTSYSFQSISTTMFGLISSRFNAITSQILQFTHLHFGSLVTIITLAQTLISISSLLGFIFSGNSFRVSPIIVDAFHGRDASICWLWTATSFLCV